jgi:hypothetical protein
VGLTIELAGWVDTGADLALWPSSIKILKELGVEPRLWSENSYVVKKVSHHAFQCPSC